MLDNISQFLEFLKSIQKIKETSSGRPVVTKLLEA